MVNALNKRFAKTVRYHRTVIESCAPKENGDLVPFTIACRRARRKQLFTGGSALIDLSKHVFERLRKDQGSILYRGRKEEDSSQVLVLAPTKEEPEPESLKRLENEYSLREELDPAWAARPIELTFHWNRPVLVLEDPGGMPLSELLGQASDLGSSLRLAIDLVTTAAFAADQGGEAGRRLVDVAPAV